MSLAKHSKTFYIDMETIIEAIEESVKNKVPLSNLKSNLKVIV